MGWLPAPALLPAPSKAAARALPVPTSIPKYSGAPSVISGHRAWPEFFTDWYETALAPNEMVTAVTLPPGPPGALGRYHKLARVSGDFATVSVALVLAMEAGACAHVAIAVGGCGPIPARLTDVEAALVGGGLDAAAVAVAGAALAEMLDPVDDVRASADYRRKVAPRMIARAIIEAKAELEGAG